MEIEQAMAIVKNVFANTHGNLADHQAMQQVVLVLEAAIKKEDKE